MWQRSINFEIQEMLGEGGQGGVYRAIRRDPATGLSQTVAVKILHSETEVDSWKREFESLSRVRSPFCVQVFGFERVQQRPALLLEYIDGVSLANLGKGCWLSEEDILEILAQTESAILDLHKFGSFHGDLSPRNILIDREGHLRLLDFGLANSSAQIQRATPAFAAPERLVGQSADLAADIFSLGRVEQFLRGREPVPDPHSPYLALEPSRRSLRGLFSNAERRQNLGLKIREHQRRLKLARDLRTRTQAVAKISSHGGFRLAAALTIIWALCLPGSAPIFASPLLPVLSISTHKWHHFKLDGKPVGYSPLQLSLTGGRTHMLEWISAKGRGQRKIRLLRGGFVHLDDRDFSH